MDFGEVHMFINGTPCKHAILILTMPYSNLRMANLLPAQNFECLAKGLSQIFEEIGRVPQRIRCDNMKTAVSKIILRDKLLQETDVWDAMDHPRRLTNDFKLFMHAYGFVAEFCNASSGYEKGSVENAVGWIRRNCFIPSIAFDGDYVALNKRLVQFCWKESKLKHYYFRDKTIEELFAEERPRMLTLPDKPFEASTWGGEATVNNLNSRFTYT